MSDRVLLEDESFISLEDGSGFMLMETGEASNLFTQGMTLSSNLNAEVENTVRVVW